MIEATTAWSRVASASKRVPRPSNRAVDLGASHRATCEARGVHILVIDEAQFASVEQIDALARAGRRPRHRRARFRALGGLPAQPLPRYRLGSSLFPIGRTSYRSLRRAGAARRAAATPASSTASSRDRGTSSSLATSLRVSSTTKSSVARTTGRDSCTPRADPRRSVPKPMVDEK